MQLQLREHGHSGLCHTRHMESNELYSRSIGTTTGRSSLCIRGIQGHAGKKASPELLNQKLIEKKGLFHFSTMSGTPRTRTQPEKVAQPKTEEYWPYSCSSSTRWTRKRRPGTKSTGGSRRDLRNQHDARAKRRHQVLPIFEPERMPRESQLYKRWIGNKPQKNVLDWYRGRDHKHMIRRRKETSQHFTLLIGCGETFAQKRHSR